MNSVCVSILPSSISSIDGAGGRLIDEKTFSLVIPEYTKKKKKVWSHLFSFIFRLL
jgi:hypothetical protein